MIPIKDLLNKIKWDKSENPDDYIIVFIDLNKERSIPYSAIKRFEGNFMVIDKDNEEVEIPMHRIRKVLKKSDLIWKR